MGFSRLNHCTRQRFNHAAHPFICLALHNHISRLFAFAFDAHIALSFFKPESSASFKLVSHDVFDLQ